MRTVRGAVPAAILLLAAHAASAASVCTWMVETAEADDVRNLQLWVQSDVPVDLYYELAGDGLVDSFGKYHSPSSGSLSLDAGEAVKPWDIGVTFNPPGRVDVVLRLHAPSASGADASGPVLAEFAFRREIAEGEPSVPPVLARKQCAAVQSSR